MLFRSEDMSLLRYAEGKTELLNESGRVNLKHIKAAGVSVQFHQPDRFKVCNSICQSRKAVGVLEFWLAMEIGFN